MKIITFTILTILLLSACSDNNESNSAPAPAPANNDVLIIKGVHVGMDGQKACEVLASKFNISKDQLITSKQQGDMVCSPKDSSLGDFMIKFDSDGNVNQFLIGSGSIGELFGTSGLSDTDFLQKFIDAYNIPKMDHINGRYIYAGRGVKVKYIPNMMLFIMKIEGNTNESFD